jgi:hypothetical protein
MSQWSLPPLPPPSEVMNPEWLFEQWTSAMAWNWLRAGHLDLQDQSLLNKLATYALRDLGVSGQHLTHAWNLRRPEALEEPWGLPLVRLPVTPSEVWPDPSHALAETSVGLLAALVANGWNAFAPFLPFPMPTPQKGVTTEAIRPAWGIEIVMGHIGQTHISEAWRLAIADQMLRTPSCPSLKDLRKRVVCKTKNNDKPVPWLQAAIRYRQPVAARICVEGDIHFGLGKQWPEALSSEERVWWERCFINRKTSPSPSLVQPINRSRL